MELKLGLVQCVKFNVYIRICVERRGWGRLRKKRGEEFILFWRKAFECKSRDILLKRVVRVRFFKWMEIGAFISRKSHNKKRKRLPMVRRLVPPFMDEIGDTVAEGECGNKCEPSESSRSDKIAARKH